MQKIAFLYEASQEVLSTFDLDQVLQQILSIARDYFHIPNATIFLLDQESQQLYVRSHIGWDPDIASQRISIDTGIIGAAAKQKRPIYTPDVSKDPRYLCAAAHINSELAIPMVVQDEVVGVLDFQSEKVAHFDAETIDLLTLFPLMRPWRCKMRVYIHWSAIVPCNLRPSMRLRSR